MAREGAVFTLREDQVVDDIDNQPKTRRALNVQSPLPPADIPNAVAQAFVSEEALSDYIKNAISSETTISRIVERRQEDLVFEIQQPDQRGADFPPSEQPVLQNPVDRVRYPSIIFTEDYLNDPIQFSGSKDFYPDVIPPQIQEILPQYTKDVASYTVVYRGGVDRKESYSVLSKSPLFDKNVIVKEIDYAFEEF